MSEPLSSPGGNASSPTFLAPGAALAVAVGAAARGNLSLELPRQPIAIWIALASLLIGVGLWQLTQRRFWRDELERAAIFAAVEAFMAFGAGPTPWKPTAIAVSILLLVYLLMRLRWSDLRGTLEWTRARAAAMEGAIATAILLAVVIALATIAGWPVLRPGRLLTSFVTYPLGAAAQQALLFGSCFDFAGARPRWPAALSAALLFGVLHWPNGPLMAACFLGMAYWAWSFARHRSLLVTAISMGLLATAFIQLLPDRWTEHARVGRICVERRERAARWATPSN